MTYLIPLIIVALVLLIIFVPVIRRNLITRPLMKTVSKTLPRMGETERVALNAGTVWWDAELFSGKPNWATLLDFKIKGLSAEEQAFINGPLEELCALLDDWQIQQERDLPPNVWGFIKTQGFLGLIIPTEYGGLGFSAHAHSLIVAKLSTRSVAAAVTVMVPNSLGPGELLLHYGTPAQKKHYLPRLARGDDIPCFALTEPTAGSDAANGQSRGVVCKQVWQGKETLGIRLTFNKRYITLAPVASVIGLAFRLLDPDHLLGPYEDVGITCALLPRDTPGLIIGQRHDPMDIPFQNGPVQGTDVFVPLDYIIGGRKGAGQGWRMLMESLAAGRGISLPSQAVGAAQLATKATSAYAMVREQFGLPIARFEGIRERLSRIAGHSYFMEAGRRLAFGAVDAGEKPSVISAIVKAYLTDGSRTCINDAMDIHAGSAICRGPGNLYSRAFSAIPIGITVEGANILTRSLILFGQGAIRCHPYILKEMEAVAQKDLKQFDRAFFGHLAHIFCNARRAFEFGASCEIFAYSPIKGKEARHYRSVTRYSAAFAFLSDVALAKLGGAMKRKEYLSGRFADVFAWLYLTSATLKHFHDRGCPDNERALLDWVMAHGVAQIENGLSGIISNLPGRWTQRMVRLIIFPLGTKKTDSDDRLTDLVAQQLTQDLSLREQLTHNVYQPAKEEPGLGELEAAFHAVHAAKDARQKLQDALKSNKIEKGTPPDMLQQALAKKLLTPDETERIEAAEHWRDRVIQVSAFDPETYKNIR